MRGRCTERADAAGAATYAGTERYMNKALYQEHSRSIGEFLADIERYVNLTLIPTGAMPHPFDTQTSSGRARRQ